MSFCTAINCMDGRTQRPVNAFARERFEADYVDTITEPGPNAILAGGSGDTFDSILRRLDISVHKHHSAGIVVVGHWECAGNPVPEDEQNRQTRAAVELLRARYPELPVVGVWVDADWRVNPLD